MNTKIALSSSQQGRFALVGHVGVAHAYSADGFIQEDSCGFAILAGLMAKALEVDMTIKEVVFSEQGRKVSVHTQSGGVGEASFDEGFTPWEEDLICRNSQGLLFYAPQSFVQKVMGRINGHGTNKSAAVLCEAVAKAIVDSFRKTHGESFVFAEDDQPASCGCFLGTVLDFGSHPVSCPVSCMLTVNASPNGTGPNEDTEGNVCIGAKGRLMKQLGMLNVPTIILEAKQYNASISKMIDKQHFIVRWNEQYDNPVVAACLKEAAEALDFPTLAAPDSYPRQSDSLQKNGGALADEIIVLAEEFRVAALVEDKIRIVAALARIASKDIGGVIFMSNHLHNLVGSGGLWPGSAAVLSIIVPESYIKHWKLPFVTPEDIADAEKVLIEAVKRLSDRYDVAQKFCMERGVDVVPSNAK